jgi:hypothetical protein
MVGRGGDMLSTAAGTVMLYYIILYYMVGRGGDMLSTAAGTVMLYYIILYYIIWWDGVVTCYQLLQVQ